MSNGDATKTGSAKSRLIANKAKKASSKTAKLKSRPWYQDGARSIAINKPDSLDSRNNAVNGTLPRSRNGIH